MASAWAPIVFVLIGVVAVSFAVAYLTTANKDALRSLAMAEDARIPYFTVDGHALGEATTEESERACVERCAQTDTCVASVYNTATGQCTLRSLARKDDTTLFVRYDEWGYNKFPRRTLNGHAVLESADGDTAADCKKRCDGYGDACHFVRFGTADGEGTGRCEVARLTHAGPDYVANWRT